MEWYDTNKFLDSILDKGFPEIIDLTDRELGNVAKSRPGSAKYVDVLKGFLFFMKQGIKPMGVEDADFAKFRSICEKLVAKGQFTPNILDYFKNLPAK